MRKKNEKEKKNATFASYSGTLCYASPSWQQCQHLLKLDMENTIKKQTEHIYLNKYECNMDQKLPDADANAYLPGRHFACTHQMATLICVK